MTSGIATISSAGIGSGLDVNGIVTKLMAVEQTPLTKLQTTSAALQTQLSAFGQMQSAISALHDAAVPLFAPSSFTLTNSSSSDPSSLSATTTASAVPGTYTVSVQSLSAAQSLVSPIGQFQASTDVVGTGSLTVRLGTWNAGQTVFTPKTGSADIVIPIDASANTLAGIRDKINAAGAGISATLITDASGSRIALQSTTSGVDNGFRVTVADDDLANADNQGLSRLAFDPAGGAAQMVLAQAGANTQATINGIAVSSANNSLAEVVGGMTFNLSKITAAPVTVVVTRNTDSIRTQLANFVGAYNQLNKFLTDSTKYDPTSKQAALLQGDGTTVSIQNQLHAMLSKKSGASTVFSTLSALGVQIQKDGSLLLDPTTVNAALTNLPQVTKALSNVDATTPGNNGFAKNFSDWTDQMLGSSGTLPGKTKSIQARMASNQKDQDAMSLRLTATEARLRAQYSSLDSTMSTANALSSFMTQQITNWNKSTG
jgi:flagellar hook-associated protein 2